MRSHPRVQFELILTGGRRSLAICPIDIPGHVKQLTVPKKFFIQAPLLSPPRRLPGASSLGNGSPLMPQAAVVVSVTAVTSRSEIGVSKSAGRYTAELMVRRLSAGGSWIRNLDLTIIGQ